MVLDVNRDGQSIVEPVRWRYKRVNTPLSRVPPIPGLYAFSYDEHACHGLTANRRYVYIGETGNLKRRLGQHLPGNEINVGLRDFLRRNPSSICWYCPMADVSTGSRRKIEAELIRYFQPQYNLIGK